MADIPTWDQTEDVEPSWESTSDVAVSELPTGYQRIEEKFTPEQIARSGQSNGEIAPASIAEKIQLSPWISGTGPERLQTRIIPKELLDTIVENTPNLYTASKLLPKDSNTRKFAESFKQNLTEGGSSMSTPEAVMEGAPLAIPVVGQGLALGLGAKMFGQGAGRAYAGIEQGNPNEAGAGSAESALGLGMLLPVGAKTFRDVTPSGRIPPPEPPIEIQSITRPEPPIIRRATQAATDAGLTRSAAALEKVKPAADKPALTPEPVAATPPDAVVTPAPVADFSPVKTTENAWDFGRARQTPEGIAEIEAIKSGITQELTALRADKLLPPMEKLNRMSDLATRSQLATEALQAAKNVTDRPAMTEYFSRQAPEPSAPVMEAGAAPETVRLYRGQGDETAGGAFWSDNPDYARSFGDKVQVVDVPKAVADAARAEFQKTGSGTPGAHILSPEWTKQAKPLEAPLEAKVTDLTPEPAVEPALAEAGMGGMRPGERLKAPLAAVTDSLKTMAKDAKPSATKAFDLGRSLAPIKDRISDTVTGLQAAGGYLKEKLEGKPKWDTWKDALGERHLALSESTINARKYVNEARKAVPDKVDREAISNYVDTGGDAALLDRASSETPARYKAGYERAKNLTPDQKIAAENLRQYFEKRLEDAQEAGILEDGIENYLHRIYEKDSDFKKGAISELRSGLFAGKPALAKKRVFEYDLDAEKAGFRPVKDFIQRVAAYDLSLNKAIADRTAVKAMMEIKMPDGRPMIDVGGGGKVIEAPTGETQATLINRSARKIDESNPAANRGDYKSYDHPALRKWKWAASDAEGNPIFVQGDVLVHPDAVSRLENLLGKSRIRANPIGRAALNVSSTIKQTMLDLSGFHQVQIGVHGLEHRTFKPVKEIDFTDPDVRGLIKGGAVVGETNGSHLFSEGLSGSSLTKHIPVLGEWVQRYQSYLFEDYIPRLKMAMGLHALERNAERFPNLNKQELYHLTANQMNAAFGELNYEMMGRSKTMQDALRLSLLAPDFLEARGRFSAQAGTKYGSEQRQALLLGAGAMYVTARIINKLLDDEYHWEPKNAFNIVYKGKAYGLRTVQGDLIHAATDPGKFANHRLNPTFGKPVLEALTGRDYFGRKRDLSDKLRDLVSTPIPISLKGIFSGREQNLAESLMNSFGLTVKRNSPSSEITKLAQDWLKENKVTGAPGEFIYDADKDPYRDIKLAADYYDVPAVRSEIEKAIGSGLTKAKIREHFRLSANRNFTGNAKEESKFLNSLTKDQRDLYQKAKTERFKIKNVVEEALR